MTWRRVRVVIVYYALLWISAVLRGVTGITVVSLIRADIITSKSSIVQQPYTVRSKINIGSGSPMPSGQKKCTKLCPIMLTIIQITISILGPSQLGTHGPKLAPPPPPPHHPFTHVC